MSLWGMFTIAQQCNTFISFQLTDMMVGKVQDGGGCTYVRVVRSPHKPPKIML